MLELKRIREDPDGVRMALARRGGGVEGALQGVIELDERRRALLPELEGLRAEQNEANTRIRGAVDEQTRQREIEAMRSVAARAKELEQELASVEASLQEALGPLPNLPDPTAAPGPEDELVREVGTIAAFDFPARDHLELAGGLIDMDSAAHALPI
jgi:seryl-tRNA synthetase